MIDVTSAWLASDMLVASWLNGRILPGLPPDIRPKDRAGGYAIQQLIERHSNRPLFGWKIAATSTAGQRHIGVDGPLAGRLLAEHVVKPGLEVALHDNRMRVVEVEFAFRMRTDLPPRASAYDVSEVVAAIATLHPAIEIPDSRYSDFTIVGAPQLIADNACAHQFVLGAATAADWRALDLARHKVRGIVVGRYEREGLGANVLGNPYIALTWIANELSGLGITLRAGQVVTTGTCIIPLEVEPGDRVEAHMGEIGDLSIEFV